MPPSTTFPPVPAASWTELKSAARLTPARSGHVSFPFADGRLLIFGGYAEESTTGTDSEKHRYVVNDMWEWASQQQGWLLLPQSPAPPPGPRLVSAVGVADGAPHMLGGWDPQAPGSGGVQLDSVHRFDAARNAWAAVRGAALPGGGTSRHVCVSLPDGRLLLHTHRCTGFVYIFDGVRFERQSTTGAAPSSRGLHAATMLGRRHALFFGGAVQGGAMSNEAFVLNVETWALTRLEIEGGDAPSPRAAPCLCAFDERRAILYGGASVGRAGLVAAGDVWVLAVDERYARGRWELLEARGAMPPARNAATLDVVSEDGEGTKEFLLAGGWAPFVETYNDNFVLKVSERPIL